VKVVSAVAFMAFMGDLLLGLVRRWVSCSPARACLSRVVFVEE
jgi:hypothetical protein